MAPCIFIFFKYKKDCAPSSIYNHDNRLYKHFFIFAMYECMYILGHKLKRFIYVWNVRIYPKYSWQQVFPWNSINLCTTNLICWSSKNWFVYKIKVLMFPYCFWDGDEAFTWFLLNVFLFSFFPSLLVLCVSLTQIGKS